MTRGDRMSARVLNELGRAVNELGVMGERGPGEAEPDPETMLFCVNKSNSEARPGSIVQFQDAEVAVLSGNLPKFQQPVQTGLSKVGIVSTGTAASGEDADGSWVRFTGAEYVVYSKTTLPSAGYVLKTGDRLGTRKDEWWAQYDQLGALIVLEAIDDTTAWAMLEDRGWSAGGLGMALCLIKRQRGDHKLVDADVIDTDISGPYQTIIWWTGFTVAESEPGITDVTIT